MAEKFTNRCTRLVITREAMVARYLPVLKLQHCIADRSVAENYLRLVIDARCDVPRLDVLSTASLCPAIFVVLLYLLTVRMNFVCWFIFRCSFH